MSVLRKDPDEVRPFHVVWCSLNGVNDGGAADTGELQGATIATSDWTVPTGITKDSANVAAVSIRGVSYAINTVATIWLSGGTAQTVYTLVNRITTSDGRTLDQSVEIRVNGA